MERRLVTRKRREDEMIEEPRDEQAGGGAGHVPGEILPRRVAQSGEVEQLFRHARGQREAGADGEPQVAIFGEERSASVAEACEARAEREVQRFVGREPRVGILLGGRSRLAYLMAPIYLRDAAADAAFPPPAYFDGKPFVGERFVEEQAAFEWLQAAGE